MGDPAATQVERTALAWQRTAISTLVLAAVSLGAAVRSGRAAAVLVTALATVLAAAAAIGVGPSTRSPASRRLLLVAAAAAVMAGAGTVVAMLAVLSPRA